MSTFDLLRDRIVGNGTRADRHVKMNSKGATAKYSYVKRYDGPDDEEGEHLPITDGEIHEHIDGLATYGVILIGADGLASAGLAEQDAGGEDRARRLIEAAQARGVHLAVIVCKGSDGRDGCHPWVLYNGRYDPAHIRHQMEQVAQDADASTDELYPSLKAIRLPGGRHTHTNDYGRLLLSTGERYDMNDPAERVAGFIAWAALPLNEAPPEPPKPTPQPIERKITRGEQAAEDMAIAERYAAARAWLRDHYDLVSELEGAGAKKTRNGYACPFCTHTHTTTLTIAPGSKAGFSHSPNCKLYSRKGFDATNVLILRGSYRGFDDMACALAPHCFPEPKPNDECEPPHGRIPEAAAHRRQDAARKKAARRQAAADLRADVLARATADTAMPHCAHHQLDIHLAIADQRGWHRASVARRAEMAGYSERWTQIANKYLIEHGYLRRDETSGTTTAIWTFIGDEGRAPVETSGAAPASRENQNGSPVLDLERDLTPQPVGTCERRARGEPDSPDTWEWQADAHGADELNALETWDQPIPAFVPEPPTVTCSDGDTVPRWGGLSPREQYTLRRIAGGDVLRMERVPDAEPEGEQIAFIPPVPAQPEPSTPLDWAHLRWLRKQGRQRRLVRRTGPPVEVRSAKRLPVVELPAFLTGDVSAPIVWEALPAPRSQAPTGLGPPLASVEGTPASLLAGIRRHHAAHAAGGD
jgi:hypothetical protein